MGFTPREVGEMMAWEFGEAEAGYRAAHGGENDRKPQVEWDDADLRAAGVEGF